MPVRTTKKTAFKRSYDFSQPLDDLWEVIPGKDWSFDRKQRRARFVNRGSGKAEIYLRPCSIYGDTIEFRFVPEDHRAGLFTFGFIGGFEYITFELDLTSGNWQVRTHEFHKSQPRLRGKTPVNFTYIKVIRERDDLPGLPYEGSSVALWLDDKLVARVSHIDFIPECLLMFGFKGPGELSLASFSIRGPERPRPEYVHVGLWQQSCKPTTAQNVNSLIEGVRQAAAAGVQNLLTPETSLTGLRPDDPELSNRDHVQSELRRFRKAIGKIPCAPHTLTGYPEWIKGTEVEAQLSMK